MERASIEARIIIYMTAAVPWLLPQHEIYQFESRQAAWRLINRAACRWDKMSVTVAGRTFEREAIVEYGDVPIQMSKQ